MQKPRDEEEGSDAHNNRGYETPQVQFQDAGHVFLTAVGGLAGKRVEQLIRGEGDEGDGESKAELKVRRALCDSKRASKCSGPVGVVNSRGR